MAYQVICRSGCAAGAAIPMPPYPPMWTPTFMAATSQPPPPTKKTS